MEIQRLQNEAEEKAMNEAGGEDGYPWSRREEMKALAITKGWRAVFAGLSSHSPFLTFSLLSQSNTNPYLKQRW